MSTSGGTQNKTDSSHHEDDAIIISSDDDEVSALPLVDTKRDVSSQPSTSKAYNYPLVVSDPDVEVEYNPKLNIFETKKQPSSFLNVPKPLLSFVEHKMRKRSICLPRDKPPCKKSCTDESDVTTTKKVKIVRSTNSSSLQVKSKIDESSATAKQNLGIIRTNSSSSLEKSKTKELNVATTKKSETIKSAAMNPSLSLAQSEIGDKFVNPQNNPMAATHLHIVNASSTSMTATNRPIKIVSASFLPNTPKTATNLPIKIVSASFVPNTPKTTTNLPIKIVDVSTISNTPKTATNLPIKIISAPNFSSTSTSTTNLPIKIVSAPNFSSTTDLPIKIVATSTLSNFPTYPPIKFVSASTTTATGSQSPAFAPNLNDEEITIEDTTSDATQKNRLKTTRTIEPIPLKEFEKIWNSEIVAPSPKLKTVKTIQKVAPPVKELKPPVKKLKTVRKLVKISAAVTNASLESETLYITESTSDDNFLSESATDPFDSSTNTVAPYFTDQFDTSTNTVAPYFTDPFDSSTNTVAPSFTDPFSTSTSTAAPSFTDPFSTSTSTAAPSFTDPFSTSTSTAAPSFTDPFSTSTSTAAPSFTDPFSTSTNTVAPSFTDPFSTSTNTIARPFTDPFSTSSSSNNVTSPTSSLVDEGQTSVLQATTCSESLEVTQSSNDVTPIASPPSEQLEPNSITFVDIDKVKIEPNEENDEVQMVEIVKNKPKCLKCTTEFNDLREIRRHMKSEHSSELPCIQCDIVHKTRELLLDHLMGVHHICVTCRVRFLNRKSFAKHHTEHADGRVFIYQCTMCHSVESTFSDIQRHIQLNHRLTLIRRDAIVENYRKNIPLLKLYNHNELQKMNVIQCNYCLVLLKKDRLEIHYKFSHCIINCENCRSLISLSQTMPDDFEALPVQCKYCDYKFEISKNDSKHFQVNRKRLHFFEDVTTHECKHCFKYFSNVLDRNNHEFNCPCEHKNHEVNFELGINIELSSILLCHLPCIFCKKLIRYADLVKHLTDTHHYCGVCDESFATSAQFQGHKKAHEKGEITHIVCNVCFIKLSPKQLYPHFENFHPYALVREKFLKRVSVELPSFYSSAVPETVMCAFCYVIFRKPCDMEEHLRRRHHIYCCNVCKFFAFLPDSMMETNKVPKRTTKNARKQVDSQSTSSNDSTISLKTSHTKSARSHDNSTNLHLLSTNDVPSTSNHDKPQYYTYSQLLGSFKSNDSRFALPSVDGASNTRPSTSSLNDSTIVNTASSDTSLTNSGNICSPPTPTTCNEYEFIDIKKEIVDDDTVLQQENLNEYQLINIKQEVVDDDTSNFTPFTTVMIPDINIKTEESSFKPETVETTSTVPGEIETKIEIVEENIIDFESTTELGGNLNVTEPIEKFKSSKNVVEKKRKVQKSKQLKHSIQSKIKEDLGSEEHKTYSFIDVNEIVMDSCCTTVLTKNLEPKCFKCGLYFKNRKEFLDHISTIHSLDLPCTICDMVISKREGMVEHLSNVHHICVPCRLQFPDETTFLEHKNEHNNNRVYLYRCCQCGMIVTSFGTIQRHLQTIHRQLAFPMDFITKVCRKDVAMLKYYSKTELKEMNMIQCNYCLKLLKPDKAALHYKYFHYIVQCANCKCIIILPKYFNTNVKLNCDYCDCQMLLNDLVHCKFLYRQGKGYQKFENIKTYECRYCFRYFPNVSQKNEHEFQCPCDHKNHLREIESLPKNVIGCVNDPEDILSCVVPCVFCNKYLEYKRLAAHLMDVHKYCGVCDDSFPQFQEHKNLHENNQIQHITCNRCFHNYSPKKMVTHVQKYHGNKISNQATFKTVTVKIPQFKLDTGGSTIICAVCYGYFHMFCDFEEHLRRRHNIFSCIECRYFILQDVRDS